MIRIKLGGYLDENDKIMTKTELDERILKMQDDLALAVEALNYYASNDTYGFYLDEKRDMVVMGIEFDKGEKARESLAKIRGDITPKEGGE